MSKRKIVLGAVLLAAVPAWAGVQKVRAFGDGGWKSDDTRTGTGVDLVGFNFTHAGKPGQPPTVADDLAIAQQLQFVAGPGGSLYGGALKVIAPAGNPGKSTLSVIDTTTGFGAAAGLLTDFTASYQWYMEPNPTNRTLAFRLGIQSAQWAASQASFTATRSGESSWDLILVHVPAGSAPLTWHTVQLSPTVGNWRLYRQAGNSYFPDPGATEQTLTSWAADAYWGPILFGTGAQVTNIQFGLGSWQQNCNAYVDYLQTTLLNDGDVIDFAEPLPAQVTLVSDQACYQVDDDVIVNIELSDAATEIVGGQFWLEYDASQLSYTPSGSNPVGVAPWSVLIWSQHTAPVIFLSVGIPDGGVGARSGPMAQLTFKAVAEGCNVQDAVRFKTPDGTPPTRLGDRYDNAIYPVKVNLAPIAIDSTPPVITCTNITTTADPGQCGAAFIETFDDPVALCPTGAPECWQIDRKAPAIFTNGTLGGENVLHHGIRAADFVGCGNFYATQGRSYPLDMPVGTVLAVDVYIPSDYAANLRNVGLWGVTYDAYPQVSGYPIVSYASTNPANGCDPTPSSPRFRYFTQDTDQDASNGYQAGYVTMMPVTTFDVWYRLEIELTNSSYIFRV